MKRSITALLAVILLQACEKKAPDYVVLSGKFAKPQGEKITVKSHDFEKEIAINADGSFSDTLHIAHNGMYRIGRKHIYLHKGKNVSFSTDNETMEPITYTGDLAVENNYLADKDKTTGEELRALGKHLYSFEEPEFLNKVNELTNKQKEMLNAITPSVADFKENELKNINYGKDYWLANYEFYHGYFIKNNNFKVSDNFPKVTTTDFDNEADFNFSPRYADLIMSKFQKDISDEYEKRTTGVAEGEMSDEDSEKIYRDLIIENFKKTKSRNIKNSIASSQIMSGGIPDAKTLDFFYNDLVSNVTNEDFKKVLNERYEKIKALEAGKPSPSFNFENHKGGTTSLEDFKGKVVYVDVWATWCGPCIGEIPHLKELEKQYHGKNIEFVSISVDEKRNYEKWKQFVTDQGLVGTQLIADNDWKSDFVTNYLISGIPRFILIDTEGKIVSADAPRPSNKKIVELFTQLGL
ncbi:TlpA family protein disulfide reductase [Capnocytophaga stomatis]|uniref:Thioredoxin family protein n=1 Tax=Capnocytophaga stomatis TaxID=1848904 RepID=A0A250FUW1_9FLAO|nr:TlpA disulfide reductase family protein [Capnocytophaga stomatis]ATA88942.1 thioredoxin family protein [Capnocytophaga stomatis]GIJ94520.1 hypothetical protein CAPN002_17380 [Capnocytophaga stomatis]GIJ95751.1 hypothetical protein CAPN001_03200 [Capnocytophaga stomatis]GIM48869.1 hypothetical protein CAPN003_03210 [Capnocytophaga stomatis]